MYQLPRKLSEENSDKSRKKKKFRVPSGEISEIEKVKFQNEVPKILRK